MARFVITDPQERTQIFEISTPILSIGRADSNDLVLHDSSESRHHARVSVTGIDTALLVDLGSLNGTFVNGHQVEEHPLADQDQISIGAFELRYELPAEPPLQVEAGSQMAEEVAELLSEEGLDVAAAQKAKE